MRLFSASLLLRVDFYVGRQLDRMFRVEDLARSALGLGDQ